jgi:methanesulfonate monooxygenase large subunit
VFRDEMERIMRRTWRFVCHESEVGAPGSYRATTVAGRPLLIVRGHDGAIRTFYNICRHRGAKVVRDESGCAKAFQCFYHLWTYDLEGHLTGITRSDGYARTPLEPDELGLIPVRTESVVGLVFVCMDPDAPPLREYLGEMVPLFEAALGTHPMEVFQFYKATFKINWKLWQENNSETYHAYLHVLLRKTAAHLRQETPMRIHLGRGGHCGQSSGGVNTFDYTASGYSGVEGGSLPTLAPNELRIVNVFPDLMINIRSNVVRLDRMEPLAPGLTLIEWRGLAVQGDSEELRAVRLKHHNMFWGPAGRNLLEDMIACESQQECMASDVVRYSIVARDEDLKPTDDSRIRHFYSEWSRRMNRSPHDPFAVPAQNGGDPA